MQQLYAGWALLGVVVVAALLSSGAVAWLYRRNRAAFRFALAATALVALGLLVFFVFTFPANQATENWTVLPEGWEALRARWEYSHAVAATLNFLALASLSLAVIERRGAR